MDENIEFLKQMISKIENGTITASELIDVQALRLSKEKRNETLEQNEEHKFLMKYLTAGWVFYMMHNNME